jgi:hypothetical protein
MRYKRIAVASVLILTFVSGMWYVSEGVGEWIRETINIITATRHPVDG